MRFANPYFIVVEKMELLQRWIIVHSILYYEHDVSVVTDAQFDSNSRQLVELMQKHPQAVSKTKYAYCMHDFDGSTGFDLPSRLNEEDGQKLRADASRLGAKYRR